MHLFGFIHIIRVNFCFRKCSILFIQHLKCIINKYRNFKNNFNILECKFLGLGIKMLSDHILVSYRLCLKLKDSLLQLQHTNTVLLYCLIWNDVHPLMLTEFIPLNRSPDPTWAVWTKFVGSPIMLRSIRRRLFWKEGKENIWDLLKRQNHYHKCVS